MQQNSGSGKSIKRYYDISPTNNTNLNAILRFRYLDAELNGLTESTLKVRKSTTTEILITTSGRTDITARRTLLISSINSLARFTLSSSTFTKTGKLGVLQAAPQTDFVALTWGITPGFSSEKFMIERSADSTNWYAIGSIPFGGNPFATEYSFNDLNPPANKAYYRVQAISSDGASATNIAAVQPGAKIEASLTPNPVITKGKVTIQARSDYNAVLKVFAADGRQVMQQPAHLSKGINQIEINVNTLAKGMYYLVIESLANRAKKNILFYKQ